MNTIIDLGRIDYEEAYRIQKDFVAERKAGRSQDTVLLAEHYEVFTIGRTGSRENLLFGEEELLKRGIKILRVDRGGDITFHGPGQLVLYPILDLKSRGRDLHKYLRLLEEVVIVFLNEYSVSGTRINGRTGVWVEDKKIASIGIGSSNWITYHGLSVNINVDLNFFSMINPCGFKGIQMTSLDRVMHGKVALDEAKHRIISGLNAQLA